MSQSQLVVLVHVVSAIWFISGLVGRTVVLGAAARACEIGPAQWLVDVAGVFERAMVIPGSMAVLVTGLLAAWVNDQPLLGFLQGSSANWLLLSLVLYLCLIPIVPLVLLPRGRRFEHALASANERGAITVELKAAFADPAVRIARRSEAAVVALVLVLMVTKFV